jgi:hypothetical protein
LETDVPYPADLFCAVGIEDVPAADWATDVSPAIETLDKVLGFKMLRILACRSACCFAIDWASEEGCG